MTDPRVLMVDDNEDFLTASIARLEVREVSVCGAVRGDEAVALARERRFDVIVLDLAMPGMDGVEVLMEIKRLQPFVQVIMLTGHGTIEAAMDCGRYDAFKFLTKPCDIGQLIIVIKDAHGKKRADQKKAYNEEVERLFSRGNSPRGIIEETRRLREKYEM